MYGAAADKYYYVKYFYMVRIMYFTLQQTDNMFDSLW